MSSDESTTEHPPHPLRAPALKDDPFAPDGECPHKSSQSSFIRSNVNLPVSQHHGLTENKRHKVESHKPLGVYHQRSQRWIRAQVSKERKLKKGEHIAILTEKIQFLLEQHPYHILTKKGLVSKRQTRNFSSFSGETNRQIKRKKSTKEISNFNKTS